MPGNKKKDFIQEMLASEKPFKHLCAEYGIGEKTGYKWKKRFYGQGKAGLNEQPRARLSQMNEIDCDTVAELISLKMAHKTWGPKKLRGLYSRA